VSLSSCLLLLFFFCRRGRVALLKCFCFAAGEAGERVTAKIYSFYTRERERERERRLNTTTTARTLPIKLKSIHVRTQHTHFLGVNFDDDADNLMNELNGIIYIYLYTYCPMYCVDETVVVVVYVFAHICFTHSHT